MDKIRFNLSLLLFLGIFSGSIASATTVELKGKITQAKGPLPATTLLHSTADEGFMATSNIDKNGNFSFTAQVSKAGLFNLRVMRLSHDIMLSADEKSVFISISFDGDKLLDIQVEKSPENDAYTAFKSATDIYDTKLRDHFLHCENEDSCQKVLYGILSDYTHALTAVQKEHKGTYTADVLCHMRMPALSKTAKNAADEYRKGFFENVDFSDSTIFATPVYAEMIVAYTDFLVEPSISKEEKFIKYFTDKIKTNPFVLHKSSGMLFEALFRAPREKMLGMFISWYDTGDNKTAVDNPVLDAKIKNLRAVMPGQPFIDVSAPDTAGTIRTLKEVVDQSKCTLLLFWSSGCSHCKAEMPFIQEYYQKYHSKGLGIYALSLESDPGRWKSYIKENGLSWTNVIGSYTANPNPAMQYVAVSTPTMILIDSRGNILHRFIPKTRLEAHIIEALK
jgi:thiol-disulfide isomerase/thioredoxin